MAMKVKLILVLLNSLFTIQACIRQETKERKKIYVAEHIKKEVPLPLDTSVNGIILDDTVSLNNIYTDGTYLVTEKKQSVEELQTIGLGRYRNKYKYTENMLRREHHFQQRLSHISDD